MENRIALKSMEEVFAEKFRACGECESGELRGKFKTPLQPVFVSLDGGVLIGRNDLPESKSLELDLFSGLYTNNKYFAVKYVGTDGAVFSYAGAGILTPHWFDLKTIEAAQEAALFATLEVARRA